MREHVWQKIEEINKAYVVEQCAVCHIVCIIDLDMPDTRLNHATWPRSNDALTTLDCDEVIVKEIMDS